MIIFESPLITLGVNVIFGAARVVEKIGSSLKPGCKLKLI